MKNMIISVAIAFAIAGCTDSMENAQALNQSDYTNDLVSPEITNIESSAEDEITIIYSQSQFEMTQSHQGSRLKAPPQLDRFESTAPKPFETDLITQFHSVYDPAYVSQFGGQSMAINWAIPITPIVGLNYIAYFEITEHSRTEFIILGQTDTTQVNIQLFHDIDADHRYTELGSSSDSDGDDSLIVFTEPGHYFLQFQAPISSGEQLTLVAASNVNVDRYENNDPFDHAFELIDDRNTINGNLDHPTDIDHFSYRVQRGQDLVVRLDDTYGLNEWSLEILNGNQWMPADSDSDWTLSGINPNGIAYIRVTHRAGTQHNPDHVYSLHVGTRIAAVEVGEVGSSEDLVRIGAYNYENRYLTTQIHKELDWEFKITDSTGAAMEGIKVQFMYNTLVVPTRSSFGTTGSDGWARGNETLPGCGSSPTEYNETWVGFGKNKGLWDTDYLTGKWRLIVPDSIPSDNVGVGGTEVPYVAIGHICRQTYKGLADDDGDGVRNGSDYCANTPIGTVVDRWGCPYPS